MTCKEVMNELESLGSERTKKIYMGNGAREPLFGVAIGAMKPLYKKIKKDQALAEELYASGNYDAMYFAGMIADPLSMTAADFDRWMETAYFFMISDFIVAVTLAETAIAETAKAESSLAEETARRWIESGKERYMSAGWACYEWLLGWRPDDFFNVETIRSLLDRAGKTARGQTETVSRAMNNFVAAVGVSYLPLHNEAVKTAAAFPAALNAIEKATKKGKLGFKRKAVRC